MRKGTMRDCKAWRDEGLTLSTTSDEAAKLYDMCLTQYVGWYDDPAMGGLGNTCEKMALADPNFFLGPVFNVGLQLLGTSESIQSSSNLKTGYETIKTSIDQKASSLTPREVLHGKATLAWAEGRVVDAAAIYQDILLDHPTDIHALRFVSDTYFYLGQFPQYRDNIARVLPVWEAKRPPLKSYLYGLYAFGLEETNEFEKASEYAKKGLEENSCDGWATHALAHVYEMKGRTNEGIEMMDRTVKDWEQSNFLARHNHWHRALFHLENEDWDQATEILEVDVLPRALEGRTIFDIVDCSSLMWRIKMLAPNSAGRISQKSLDETRDLAESLGRHISLFNDAHQMMSYGLFDGKLGTSTSSKAFEDASELLETLDSCSGDLMSEESIRRPLLQSIVEFRDEKYSEVVRLLEPIRYRFVRIAGSGAQRDVFSLMLIIAAMKSQSPRDKKLAKALIIERENFKGPTKLSRSLDKSLG